MTFNLRRERVTFTERLHWDYMSRYDIPLPDSAIALAFTEQVKLLIERIHASIHETRTLAVVRDALLPKLLSGELQGGETRAFTVADGPSE